MTLFSSLETHYFRLYPFHSLVYFKLNTDLPIYVYQLNFKVIFLNNKQSNSLKRSSLDLRFFHNQNNFERPKICFRNLEKSNIVFT